MKQKTVNMITKIAQKKWSRIKTREGYTKEDALAAAMEVCECYDITEDEYFDILSSII